MIPFDAAHAAVHYPPDRRFRIWIRPSFLIAAAVLVLLPLLAAWVEVLHFGLPYIPPFRRFIPTTSPVPTASRCGFVIVTFSTSSLS